MLNMLERRKAMRNKFLLAAVGAVALTGSAFAAEPLPPPPPPPPPMWTGWYIGLNAGYTFGGTNSDRVVTVPVFANVPTFGVIAADLANAAAVSATRLVQVHNSGFIGGGQVGYNWQFGNSWVAGIEADIQGTGARGSGFETGVAPLTTVANSAAVSSLSVNSAVDYLGTVRGRIGFLWTPTFLVFGDGGFAYGGVHENVEIVTNFLVPVVADGVGTFPAFGNMSNTRPGWTAGGGFEWMFLPNWSAKLEYLYYDLGRRTLTVGGLNVLTTMGNVFTDLPFASERFNGHIVRVGLNYHFWTPPPVIAKY
jgi:outer membrane immunogenic protein